MLAVNDSLQAPHDTVPRSMSQSMVQYTDLLLLQKGQLNWDSSLAAACRYNQNMICQCFLCPE